MVILFLTASGLFRYMKMQRGQSVRQGESRITGSLAQGLAVLALQKVTQEELSNPGSSLAETLAKPLDQMSDYSQVVTLEGGANDLTPVLQPLLQPIRDLGNHSFKIRLETRRREFDKIGPAGGAYPREKQGLLHLFIDITYKKINDPGAGTSENFHFVTGIKVAASIVPTLSKFTLYVENAQEGDSWRYNKVSNDANGMVSGGVKPLVLDNASDLDIPNSLNAIVRKPIGLVYLGGGPLILNLARGWGGSPEYGEAFHLYEFGKNDGLYTIEWKDHMAIMNFDQGMCSTSAGTGKDWLDLIAGCPLEDKAKFSSLLRLMGTDMQKSPTVVFGQVFRGILCARAFKSVQNPPPFVPGYLPFIKDVSVWQQSMELDPAEGVTPLYPFVNMVDELKNLSDPAAQLAKYQEKYASNLLASQPLNISLAFMATRNRDPYPAKTHFSGDSEMMSLVQSTPAPTPEQTSAIPADYRVLPGAANLGSLQAFIDGMEVPGNRTAWSIPAGEAGSIWEKFRRRGLCSEPGDRNLNCNGWIYLEGTNNLTIDKNTNLVSNGGIVLEKGNIIITKPIRGNDKILYLVTRDGNIEIRDFYGDVEASLIANKGKVIIGSGTRLKVKGSVAMSRMDPASIQAGGTIKYDPQLSARHNQTADADSEKKLLGFSVDPNPLLLP